MFQIASCAFIKVLLLVICANSLIGCGRKGPPKPPEPTPYPRTYPKPT